VGEEPSRRVHDQAVKWARAAAALPLVLAAMGCIMPDQLATFQKDVTDVQRSLETLSKSQAELAEKVAAQESNAGINEFVKRSELADLTAQLEQIVRQTTATADKVDQVNARVDRLSQDVQTSRDAARRATPLPPPTGGADAAAPAGTAPLAGSVPNPSALYSSAYADFSKGNYALAIQGFEEYAERYADTELADNALYWIGECNFSQGRYKVAVDAFDAMLEKYPRSDKAAAANLKKALAFVQLNQLGQGIEQLRFVTATYPGTDEARIASDRLQSLGKP
jgi:tol-pal system protein YbgF